MPLTIVSIVFTGCSTTSLTPTALARWKTRLALGDARSTNCRLGDAADPQFELAAAFKARDVLVAAGAQVVEREDLVALVEQPLRQVAADEARAAGDQILMRIRIGLSIDFAPRFWPPPPCGGGLAWGIARHREDASSEHRRSAAPPTPTLHRRRGTVDESGSNPLRGRAISPSSIVTFQYASLRNLDQLVSRTVVAS